MAKHDRKMSRINQLQQACGDLLRTPLKFINREHLRERQVCRVIETIASGDAPDPETHKQVIAFLSHDLPALITDNEQDLFPLLRRRCDREDEIEKVIQRLTTDHRHATREIPNVVALLRDLARASRAPDEAETATLRSFVSHARRHIILLNAIILPFARLRFTEIDHKNLEIRMGQRRGIIRKETRR